MCHQKKSDGASLQSEMACLDCLITKTGPKWVRKGLMDLSTMFHGCTLVAFGGTCAVYGHNSKVNGPLDQERSKQ